jgi:hemerythrin-like metal-binding protein
LPEVSLPEVSLPEENLPEENLPEENLQGTAREFFRLFVPLFLILALTFSAFQFLRMKVYLTEIGARESGHVILGAGSVLRDLSSLGSDILVLANGESMIRLLDENTPEARQKLTDRFSVFALNRGIYDQLRYIDETGMEVVRVNYKAGKISVVPQNQLQDKSQRYYFKDTFALGNGEVFSSPLDLNVENKKIETPYKPMLRLGMPVFDSKGRKRGIVILNYLARKLLDQYVAAIPGESEGNFILNKDGYWLYSHDSGEQWGFMFGRKRSFASLHPSAWKQMLAAETGQLQTDEGLFSFATVYPDRQLNAIAGGANGSSVSASGRFWKIGSFVSADQLGVVHRLAHGVSDLLVFMLLVFAATAGSWYLAVARVNRRRAESALHHRTEIAELLGKIAAAANEAPTASDAMQASLELVCSFTGWPVGHVYIVHEESGELYPVDIWHLDNVDHFETFREVTMKTHLEPGLGLSGRVVASRHSEWIGDVTTDEYLRHASRDGELKVKAGFAFPIEMGGEIVAVLEFFNDESVEPDAALLDITFHIATYLGQVIERERARKMILVSKEAAEIANKAKSEFLASMSHELRTPLNAVLGFAQMLQYDPQNPLSKVQNDHVESILSGGNHLLELVNEVLDLARIESDQLKLSVEDISANEMIQECVTMSRPLGEPRGITIIDNFSSGEPMVLHTDQMRFKQILLNLLSNAVKYNRDGGTITIEGEKTEDDFLRLSITDTGVGIAKKDHDRVFQMFHRLGVDPRIAREGAGVGLAVTKLLVERMAGRVDLESAENVGSTFWIELPLASNEEVLIWTNSMRIGVDAIDKDHQTILSLLNRVARNSIGATGVEEIIEELAHYARYHFKREEVVMEICNYPAIASHREQHRKMTAQINELVEIWRVSKSTKLLAELRQLLRDGLVDHIIEADTDIVKYTKGRGEDIRIALEKFSRTNLSTNV